SFTIGAIGLISSRGAYALNLLPTTWLGGNPPASNAPEYRYWLNPTLWSAGAVPNDDATNKYLVNIPSGLEVYLENVPQQFTATSATVWDLFVGGATLDDTLPLTIEDGLSGSGGTINVSGTTFTVTPST